MRAKDPPVADGPFPVKVKPVALMTTDWASMKPVADMLLPVMTTGALGTNTAPELMLVPDS